MIIPKLAEQARTIYKFLVSQQYISKGHEAQSGAV